MTYQSAYAAVAALTVMSTMAMSTAARSADLPVKTHTPAVATVVNWTGFYVGGHAGYLQSRFSFAEGGSSDSGTLKGFLGGGQIGINQQLGGWVVGLEADFSWSNADGGGVSRDPANGDVTSSAAKVRWTSLVTGRVGHTFDRALIYAKGGAAFTGSRFEAADLTTGSSSNANFTKAGWTVGGGLEYALGGPWSVRGEYDYLSFGTKDLTLVDNTGASARLSIKQNMHQFKAGVNYRFGAN